jgi:hypothetical protein
MKTGYSVNIIMPGLWHFAFATSLSLQGYDRIFQYKDSYTPKKRNRFFKTVSGN